MAEVIVNHDGKAYTVNNGVNKKGFKFDNLGGGSQRAFNMEFFEVDIENMKYHVKFQEKDTDDANGYESPMLSRVIVFGDVDPSWITSGKLDLKLLKISALNELFKSKLQIEPLNASGTVKPEFQ